MQIEVNELGGAHGQIFEDRPGAAVLARRMSMGDCY